MKEKMNNKINQYNSEVNADEIWAAIEPRVDALNAKKKKKRRGLFFLFGGLALVVLVSLAVVHFNRGPSHQTNHDRMMQEALTIDTQESNKTEKPSLNKLKNENQERGLLELNTKNTTGSETSESIKSEERSLALSTVMENVDPNSINTTENKDGSNTETIVSSSGKNTINKTETNYISNRDADNARQIKNAKREIIKTTEYVLEKLEGVYIQQEENHTGQPSTNKNEKLNSTASSQSNKNVKILGSNTANSLGTNNIIHKTSPTFTESHATNSVALLESLKIKNLPLSELSLNFIPLTAPVRKRNQQHKQKNWTASLGINGGLSSINRNLTELTDAQPIYEKLRLETETPLEAIHYSADFAVEHKSGFSLSLGYNQTDINERFDSRNVVRDTVLAEGVICLKINLRGDTTEVYGDVPVTTITSTNYEVYNRYRLVELPLILGYRQNFNKWKVGVHAGVLVNLSLSTKGRIFDKLGNIILLSEENGRYKDRIGLGYQFGLSVERPIVGRLSFRLAPTVKIYPNLMEDAQHFTSKYRLFGGQVGLSYRLN